MTAKRRRATRRASALRNPLSPTGWKVAGVTAHQNQYERMAKWASGVHFALSHALGWAYGVRATEAPIDEDKGGLIPVVIMANIPEEWWEIDVDTSALMDTVSPSDYSIPTATGPRYLSAERACEEASHDITDWAPIGRAVFNIIHSYLVHRADLPCAFVGDERAWRRFLKTGEVPDRIAIEATKQFRVFHKVPWSLVSAVEIYDPVYPTVVDDVDPERLDEISRRLGWTILTANEALDVAMDDSPPDLPHITIDGPQSTYNCYHGTSLDRAHMAFPQHVDPSSGPGFYSDIDEVEHELKMNR